MGLGEEALTAPVEVALVGCGAIAQAGYLPAMGRVPEIRCRWLVDVQRGLAERMARQWRVPDVATDLADVLGAVEAVILAVPNHLHAPMALEALSRGRAVLCEKPLGRTKTEVLALVEAARKARAALVAGMIFRQYPGLSHLRGAFPWEALGQVREVVARYGGPLDWPLSSPHLFDRDVAGGGVWLDKGPHVLDAVLWLFSPLAASVEEYSDDGDSGLEADARASLVLALPGDRTRVPCLVEVSRLRRLDNRLTVVGERATLVAPFSGMTTPWIEERDGVKRSLAAPQGVRDETDCWAGQLRAFARRVRGLEAACADGASQIVVLELVDGGYAVRKPLVFPWRDYAPWPRG